MRQCQCVASMPIMNYLNICYLLFSPVVIYIFALGLWKIARKSEYAINPGWPEFEHVNCSRQKRKGTVVICGGSVGGLLAARVCSEHYERVLIIEPEAWLATDDARGLYGWEQPIRTRIIQDRSLQAVQPALFTGLCKIFPGFEAEATKCDVKIARSEGGNSFGGTPMKDAPNPHKTLYTSRAGLETLIRRLVFSDDLYSNIEQMVGTVTGIIPDSNDTSRISKVSVRADNSLVELEAELIIDCTGITRGGLKWLERAGYGPINDLKISLDQQLNYLTVVLDVSQVPGLRERLPVPKPHCPMHFTFMEDDSSNGRKYAVFMQPDSKRILLFVGRSGDLPPIGCLDDLIGFMHDMVTFRECDPVPQWVFEMLEMLKEVEDNATYSKVRVPPTTYVQYHKATSLPSNFIALGDSVMTINPVFGQGCTKALMGVMALNHTLRTVNKSPEHLPNNFSNLFFAEQAAKNGGYWSGTRISDYGIPTTVPIKGENLSSGTAMRSYLRRLQFLAITDEETSVALVNIIQGMGTSLDCVRPSILLKVLWSKLRTPRIA